MFCLVDHPSEILRGERDLFVGAVAGRGRGRANRATSVDDRMTSFLSSPLFPSLRSALQLNLRPGGLLLQIGDDDDDDDDDEDDAANFLTESSHVRCDKKNRGRTSHFGREHCNYKLGRGKPNCGWR